jgi:hypothetical protein
MKKVLGIISILIVIVVSVSLYYKQSRDFYCLPDDKCVTVWKRVGGVCYVIPSKYYDVMKPSNDFIETTNTQYLTLYFLAGSSQVLVVKNEGTSQGFKGGFKIHNALKNKVTILDYSESSQSLIYKPNAQTHSDVSPGVELLNLDIFENYATDKNGKKL